MEDFEKRSSKREDVHNKPILTPEEVAVVLSCGRTTVYKLLADGDIASFTIGRLRRVRREDVEDFIRLRMSEHPARTPGRGRNRGTASRG